MSWNNPWRKSSVVYETADDLHWGGLFVGDRVDMAFVEGEDLCAGVSEQDGRVGGDDELCVLVTAQGVVDEKEQGKLALRGECGFGFVEKEETIALEFVFKQCEEGLAVERVCRLWPP